MQSGGEVALQLTVVLVLFGYSGAQGGGLLSSGGVGDVLWCPGFWEMLVTP